MRRLAPSLPHWARSDPWFQLRARAPASVHATVRRHQTCDFSEHATSAPAEFEDKFTMSREIEPVRRSFCRHGSCTFTEVARGGLPRPPAELREALRRLRRREALALLFGCCLFKQQLLLSCLFVYFVCFQLISVCMLIVCCCFERGALWAP